MAPCRRGGCPKCETASARKHSFHFDPDVLKYYALAAMLHFSAMEIPKTNRFYQGTEPDNVTPEQQVRTMTDIQLVQVAKRESCREAADAELARRATNSQSAQTKRQSEPSDDARHIAACTQEAAQQAASRIIKHMWVIFVLIPFVIGILIELLR